MPAGLKLAALLGVSTAVFFFHIFALALVTALLIILSLCARIRPWELLRGSGGFAVILLFVFVFRTLDFGALAAVVSTAGNDGADGLFSLAFNRRGAEEALAFAWGALLSFALGSLLFSVTTTGEIRESLEGMEKALFGRSRFALGLALTLGFIPHFFEVWEEANLAWKARAGKAGWRAAAVLLPLAIELMIEKAVETALALESRGADL